MDAYMGLEAEAGFHRDLYRILKERGLEAYITFGVHDIVCRMPAIKDMKHYRRILDDILFIVDKGRAIVGNTTSYIVVDDLGRKSNSKPTAFCFLRAGRLASRGNFDEMNHQIHAIKSVTSTCVVIGFYDIICEVFTNTFDELEETVHNILSVPGVSSTATLLCLPPKKELK